MIPWDLISKAREQRQREFRAAAQKVIQHRETFEIFQEPTITEFVDEKFPGTDISGIKIYQTSHNAIKALKIGSVGGCYIDALKMIFVLSTDSLNREERVTGKFSKLLMKQAHAPLEMIDILVHETLHAVSSLMGRATQQFTNAEEEFVYTHCVDFYHQRGMSDDDIVHTHFLPFCLNDVLSNKEGMSEIFWKLKGERRLQVVPWQKDYDRYQYEKFVNKHADFLVPEVINAAKEKANTMIECYHKYGCRSVRAEDVNHNQSIRFQSLNFD